MTTLYYTHPCFLYHNTGPDHPECADRLRAIEASLACPEFAALERRLPPLGTREQLRLIHSEAHIERVFAAIPDEGLDFLDDDTVVSPGSLTAALYAVGAVCEAVDQVFAQKGVNAFCALRPPGHHAEPHRAMGFCLFNNVAIAAAHALHSQPINRVAIVDFDVHHGNGTQAAFYQTPGVLYASIHRSPWYPGSGRRDETGVGNIVNVPLNEDCNRQMVKAALLDRILPALERFAPELLLISAGFDAHRDDPLGGLDLLADDFGWITGELLKQANPHCQGRVVAVLEGGYNLDVLGPSVAAHLRAMMAGNRQSACL